MSKVETVRVLGSMQPGHCMGTWDIAASQCAKCMLMSKCEAMTKSRRDESKVKEVAEEVVENGETMESVESVDPMEYLLHKLEGKYTRETKSNEKVVVDYFRDGEKLVFAVCVSATGSIKVESTKSKEILTKIESVEHAEAILGRLL